MPELSDLLTAFGPATIVALGTIFAAFISVRRGAQNERTPPRERIDLVTRFASIIAAGGVVTLLAITVYVSIVQMSLDERIRSSITTFEDLPHTPVSVGRITSDADKEASAILGGAGPKQWKTSTETHNVGDVRFISKTERVTIVVPNSSSDRIEEDSCVLRAGGSLKIIGFSADRNAALVSYTFPNQSRGTECDTGTYLFYPVPRRAGP